jgi:hypothetical protein
MARDTIQKLLAQEAELRKAEAAAAASAPSVAPTAAVPGTPAMGRIEATQPRPALTSTRSAESVNRDEEDRRERDARKQAERAQKDAEKAQKEAAEKAAAAPPKYVLPPDMAQVVDYGKVYEYGVTDRVQDAVTLAAEDLGMTPERLKEVAAAQGVDLDDLYSARLQGSTYEAYADAARERGVLGFLPVEARAQRLRDIADRAALVQSGADPDAPQYRATARELAEDHPFRLLALALVVVGGATMVWKAWKGRTLAARAPHPTGPLSAPGQ